MSTPAAQDIYTADQKMASNLEKVPSSLDKLFDDTMKRNWNYVEEAYKKNPSARGAKLTKSEDTALHIAISCYGTKRPSSYEPHIKGMISSIVESDVHALEILSMKNDKGNTPLHLAAAAGSHSICKCIASKCRQLISIRNAKGETPMFVAAFHGNLDAFLYLNQLNMNGNHQPDESLCRREDGNTILHVAISGEYLKLAFQIISYYPKLVNAVNVEGEIPLHVLARKPSLFESSTDFRYLDSIIYHGVIVDELKVLRDPRDSVYRPLSRINCPENYKTCIDIFFLFFTPIKESVAAGLSKYASKPNQSSGDEENPPSTEKETQSNRDQERINEDGLFPPHNATCFRLLKFFMKVTLTVIGVGFWRIQKIQEKRRKHSRAIQIMEEMITESSYRYDNYGHEPEEMEETQYSGRVRPPLNPPSATDDQEGVHHSNAETNGGRSLPPDQPNTQKTGGEKLDENGSAQTDNQVKARRETPILVAAKMGICEMLEKIIEKFPVAIHDLDSSGKNVLMLAAENRQTAVFNYLVDKNYAGFLCRQLDDKGNSTLHLAAALGEFQPWHIPGAALQMQWEIKWYKYVKHSVPQLSFAHNNSEGETPRNIFTRTHKTLVKDGEKWLIKTSESCSVVAALIATVAFASSATVPGGLNQKTGHPVLEKHPAFDVFSITSLVALTLAVTALVFFLSTITSRCQERDFKLTLPRQLLMGLSSLFASIVAMLVSFCAGHTFILRDKLNYAAVPLYAVASIPVTFFILVQLPLYFDLLWAGLVKVPRRSYKVYHH